ncbi:protocatechuate 3,4-dioxygenase subunit alpha [Nocardia miyunensis]|uniref:protocatechuate 3,4-dioxygenase subunit alpha n=1 Tax=Nocardia miyunensis TaxID=282684 RepID=UPI00082D33FD|nr:protocatechuate 3,4-dioxygenase subunit alpha [Nocardia miyunensis]
MTDPTTAEPDVANDTAVLPGTPSQTVGPFLSIGLDWGRAGTLVVPEGTPGAFWIRGEVYDGAGDRLPDAIIETWQASPDGGFDHPDDPRGRTPGWRGLGRSDTRLGEYAIHTVLPGTVPARDGRPQAPHIDVSVFARGMLNRVVTRIYFADHPDANAADPVLSTVPADRRDTLYATPSPDGYRFDIRLQGPGETVFFDV